MAVQIKIQQNEHHQGEVSIPQIAALQNLSYGAMDVEYCMIFDKVGDNYTVMYDENSVGRGFEVWFFDSDVCISLPLPNTETDIRNAYAVTEKICGIFNVDSFVCDEEFVTLKHIPQLIENNLNASLDALQRMDAELSNNTYQSFTVLAAMNPVNIGRAQMDEIGTSLEGFEKFLDRLQQMNLFYATPKYYKLDNEIVFGLFFIGENVMAVVPEKPYVPFGKIDNLKGYYVRVPDGNEVSYSDFMEHATKMGQYDANHVIVCLTEKDLAYFAANCSVAIGAAEDKKVEGVYWGKMIDNGRTHTRKVKNMQLDTEELNGLNHLAVFLKWSESKGLLSQKLYDAVPKLKELCSNADFDLRTLIAENPAFNGCLRGDHFSKMGLYFVKDFYRFNVGTGYPACVDAYAEKVLGSEKYNCEEYKNEAYLFVPYNEKYYKGLSKYIDKEWKKYK